MSRLQGITSSSLTALGEWAASSSANHKLPFFQILSTRGYKAHRVKRPNLAQPIDVNTVDILLSRTTTPTSALLPVLKNLAYLNPRQTAYMLEKLPRMAALHAHRMGEPGRHGSALATWRASVGDSSDGSYVDPQLKAQAALVSALRGVMGRVITDCSPDDFRRGLWGLAVAERSSRLTAEGMSR